MKQLRVRKGLWLAVIIAVVAAGWALARPVQAYLGNTGIPVRCVRTTPLAPGFSANVVCVPASGPEFTDSNLRVPTGHYFLVTDITVIPDGDQDIDGITEMYLHNRDAEDESVTSVRLRNVTTASYGASYRVPYLVLPAGHYLRLVNPALSQTGISVRISGLLVTNVSFLPLVTRGD